MSRRHSANHSAPTSLVSGCQACRRVRSGSFPSHPEAIAGLIELTEDVEAEVRDWAVFALGVLGDADSPEIREVLLRRLEDADVDVREEAAVGLGKRRDGRLLSRLLAMLEESQLQVRVAEAAAAYLGMDPGPENWTAENYKNALMETPPVNRGPFD